MFVDQMEEEKKKTHGWAHHARVLPPLPRVFQGPRLPLAGAPARSGAWSQRGQHAAQPPHA